MELTPEIENEVRQLIANAFREVAEANKAKILAILDRIERANEDEIRMIRKELEAEA